MSPRDVLAVLGAGFGAGILTATVGVASLLSFPVLLAVGLPPVVANASNTVGLTPGALSGSWGYRAELRTRPRVTWTVLLTSGLGSVVGALLLLRLPGSVFEALVPWLILGTCVLVGVQPRLSAWLKAGSGAEGDRLVPGPVTTVFAALTGVYGGYFGAGAGVMMLAVLALGLDLDLRVVKQGAAMPPQPDVPLWLLLTSPGHLWFLWTLVQLYAVVLLARAVARRLPGAERLGVRLGDALTRPGGVLLPAATYAVALEATGRAVGGPTTLVPEWPSTVAFLGAFLAGWFCWGRPEALPRLQRAWAPHLAIALALTVLIVPRLGATIDMEARIAPWWLRLAYAVAVWAWCYGLLGLATRVVVRENAAVRYLADASYWMYIMHLPLVLLAQLALAGVPLPLPVKVVLVVGVPTVVLLASYHLLVRSTWLGRWLNGRSYPFRWGIGRSGAR